MCLNGPEKVRPVILRVSAGDQALRGADRVRHLSRLARVALRASAGLSGLPLGRLAKDAEGAPRPVGGVFWSLSHKPALVGGVASRRPVGLDIEHIRPISDGLRAKVASDQEWRLVAEAEPASWFFRIWTAKEATLKLAGCGLRGLSRCRVMRVDGQECLHTGFAGRLYRVRQRRFGDHWVSLVSEELEVCWHALEADALRVPEGMEISPLRDGGNGSPRR